MDENLELHQCVIIIHGSSDEGLVMRIKKHFLLRGGKTRCASRIMSFPSGLHEVDMYLNLDNALDNLGGSSSVGNTLDAPQPTPTPTPRRRQHYRNLKLELYVLQNGKFPILFALGGDKPILPHVVRNQGSSRINKDVRAQQPYNHRSGSKSFLQRQHDLVEQRGPPVGHVKLFSETRVGKTGEFVSQAAANVHATQKVLVGTRSPSPRRVLLPTLPLPMRCTPERLAN
ncbi:(R)-mandelonitrile lyase 1-like [Cucumis melo var. makuwa]|uniref:(R)-mandelonitrile lyase 1-like n=1 Tax=Cucumis melo var. makuwa TaxID=1194695 RepID=A0A5D3C470_CUCMM|nr:(R)-mandelonitrile lyase 1-like [Cucumis melo var. makuwa]